MDTLTFISEDLLAQKTKRYRAALLLAAAVFAAANLFCLWLLITVTAETEKRYTLLACAAGGAGAVLAAAIWLNAAVPARRQMKHCRMLLTGESERTAFTGGLVIAQKPEQIPGSVAVYRVTLPAGQSGGRFFISPAGAKRLRALDPQSGTIEAVNGYITAVAAGKEPEG